MIDDERQRKRVWEREVREGEGERQRENCMNLSRGRMSCETLYLDMCAINGYHQ